MNRTISRWLAAALFLVAGAEIARAQADDLAALGKAVAEALGYPAERLAVSDMTTSPKAKASGGALAGILLETNDGTFAPMTLGISKRGSILTPELEAACEEALKGSDPDESAPLARVTFASGAYGFSGLGSVGAGGSGERIVATWPARGLDFQVALSLSEDGLALDDATRDYHHLVVEGGAPLAARLVEAMDLLLGYVQEANLGSLSERKGDRDNRDAPPPGTAIPPKTSPAHGGEDPGPNALRTTGIAAAAIGLLWLWLVLAKKRRLPARDDTG